MKGMLLAVTATLLLGFGATANAVPITGDVTIAANIDAVNLATRDDIDYVTFILPQTGFISFGTGDFSGLVANPVTVNDFTFDPFSGSEVIWSGLGFEFELTSVAIVSQGSIVTPPSTFLNLAGSGIMTRTGGLDATPYNWSFTATQSGTAQVALSSQANSTVPEPMSLLLLGSGLAGLGLVRRKFGRG